MLAVAGSIWAALETHTPTPSHSVHSALGSSAWAICAYWRRTSFLGSDMGRGQPCRHVFMGTQRYSQSHCHLPLPRKSWPCSRYASTGSQKYDQYPIPTTFLSHYAFHFPLLGALPLHRGGSGGKPSHRGACLGAIGIPLCVSQ